MTSTASKEGAQSVGTIKRPWRSRVSAPHLLMVVVGVAAFLANLAVLRARDETTAIAVASLDLLPGVVLDSGQHVKYVEISGSSALLDNAITEAQMSSFDGLILSAPLDEGDLINRGRLLPAAGGDGRRAMSIPIEPSNAAGGRIVIGDLIDVIAVDDGRARYVLTGVEVIDRSDRSDNGSITSSRAAFLVVGVDAGQALELASAMDQATIQVLRSTGAPPPESLEFDPASSAAVVSGR